jgi:hypothetical protein
MYDKFSLFFSHYFLVYTQTIIFPFNCPHKSFENKALNYRKKSDMTILCIARDKYFGAFRVESGCTKFVYYFKLIINCKISKKNLHKS